MRIGSLLLIATAPTGQALATAPTDQAESARVTIEDKQVADAASVAADKAVGHLEIARDEAWSHARGSLAVASDPPIRSSRVYALLSAETDRFAQLESAIKDAKAHSVHKRRVAELTGAAWDAHESLKLKKLRASSAAIALEQATTAAQKAEELEQELLRELEVEAGKQAASSA